MAQTTWEKTAVPASPASPIRWKLVLGGVAILAAVVYLIISGTASGARYFITISDLLTGKYAGQTVRVTGAVIGDTIKYDTEKLIIEFVMVDFAQDHPDLALALHNAVKDSTAARVPVRIEGQVKPDLLKHEAQAILTGKLGSNGVFIATELLLKCPSHYEEAEANQSIADPGKK